MSDQSANEVIRAAIFSAVCDAIEAFRENSSGVPNALLRDLSAVHSNTAFTNLPESVQKSIINSTNEAFRRLLKEGYVVQPKASQAPERRLRAPKRRGAD